MYGKAKWPEHKAEKLSVINCQYLERVTLLRPHVHLWSAKAKIDVICFRSFV
jgi:hypothetical protein